MREKIYTIPISEAFDKKGLCPFCTIAKELDSKYTESTLGAGMMEPDIRIMTNEKGFCREHFHKLSHLNKALPLSLVIQSHISENALSLFSSEQTVKKSFFRSSPSAKEKASDTLQRLNRHNQSCYICSRIQDTLNDYAETAIHMFKTEKDFREKFKSTQSFCLEHIELLINAGIKKLGEKDFEEFYQALETIYKSSITKLYENISEFANSFDYRAENKLSEGAKKSISDAIELL